MRNKLKSLSVILFIIFSFYLLTEISISVQATTSKTVQAPVKVSASVNNNTPLQNTIVNITVNGPASSTVKITCHYKSTNTPYTATIGSSGKVVMPVKIGRAAKGFNVVVDVSITSKGKTYTTKTSFKPK